jgi:drug/metabolite transporter (DMT)-like permease
MVLIKLGGKDSLLNANRAFLNIQINYIFLLGIFLYILSFVLWIYILQKFQVSFISPIAYGLTFVAIAVFSNMFLKEVLSVPQFIGAGLIIGGVFVSLLGSTK